MFKLTKTWASTAYGIDTEILPIRLAQIYFSACRLSRSAASTPTLQVRLWFSGTPHCNTRNEPGYQNHRADHLRAGRYRDPAPARLPRRHSVEQQPTTLTRFARPDSGRAQLR